MDKREDPLTNLESPSSVFDGGSFEITHFPTTSGGLEVLTRNSLRREKNSPDFAKVVAMRKKEALRFRRSVLRPQEGKTVDDLKNSLLARIRDGEALVREGDMMTYEDRIEFKPGFSPLVGLRNLTREKDTLTVDVIPVTFAAYLATGAMSEPREALALANPATTSCILLINEVGGGLKMLVQSRSKANHFYGGVPGASIGGFFDGELDTGKGKGKIKAINTASVLENNFKELDEELGLTRGDITDVKIIGLAKDKLTIHDEFLLLGVTSLTPKEIAEKVKKRKDQNRPGDDFDFEGNFVVLDANPETIEVLLTELLCPLPPTHAAAFLATGFFLMMEREGAEAAELWKIDISEKLKVNNGRIKKLVNSHKLDAYDPATLPEQQGLPSFEEELERLGLVKKLTLWDIDGTLVDVFSHHARAYLNAILEVFEIHMDEGELSKHYGLPDKEIVARVLRARHIDENAIQDNLDRVLDLYAQKLEQSIAAISSSFDPCLPGAREVLSHLSAQSSSMGIVTGNIQRVGEAILRGVGLIDLFDGRINSFADGISERSEIVAAAIRKAREFGGLSDDGKIFVIGDTPADIEAARRNGCISVGVIRNAHNGDFSSGGDQYKKRRALLSAANPDHLIDDLSGVENILRT